MSQNIDIKRVYLLIKNDLVENKRLLLITTATIFIFLLLLPVHIMLDSSVYFFVLYVGGFIITARSFNDLHHPTKAYQYLTLPVSNLERFLSKWLVTSIGYAVALLILFYLFSLLGNALSSVIYQQQSTIQNPLATDLWLGIGRYIIFQSIIFLGAATFKRHVLIKTAFFLGCFLLAVSFITVLISWSVCPTCFIGGVISRIQMTMSGANILFWCALAPFCWLVTYLKIRESEIQ